MTIHKREQIVQVAVGEFNDFYIKWVKKHKLTDGEVLRIIALELGSIAKYMIRFERHGNYKDRGGLE